MLREVIEVLSILESPKASGVRVFKLLHSVNRALEPSVQNVKGQKGSTDFIRVLIPGKQGKTNGGSAPTLGIIGRHGGIGARPSKVGFVSDGDGAAAALGAALKLARMHDEGDILDGDVLVTTHVCPTAPVIPHEPVEFMSSPVDMDVMNHYEIDSQMDAIISIDTTKGNRILNQKGIAISPTVIQGWILQVDDNLVSILERVTGRPAVILPLCTGDITPYGNDIFHVNSILQPATVTEAPVVGLAITAVTTVAGSATGASHEADIALAARFAVETAKDFTKRQTRFYEEEQLNKLVKLYGDMKHLQTLGIGT